MMNLCFFENIYDTEVKQIELNGWDHLRTILEDLSNKPAVKGGPNSAPLISSARYYPNTTRSNKNVECWSQWCAVDVDDYVIPCEDDITPLYNALVNICGDYKFICYSTASSTREHPKFRLVFHLKREVPAEKIQHFWHALNKEIQGIGDEQTKDISRMFYVPGKYPAFNFFFVKEGRPINPDDLMARWDPPIQKRGGSFLDRLPDELREEVINYRKKQATNVSVSWNSYHNCPFWPKRLADEYRAITGTGWYFKMYQIMVAIAANAIRENYPITAKEIAAMCRELDAETGKWYTDRPLELEADGAIEYVYRN